MATRLIYEPKGKAREYADLALNMVHGCVHGCRYCYVPRMLHEPPAAFHDPQKLRIRKDLWETLGKETAALAGDPRPILLSFTTDPYQRTEKEYRITRQALIQLLNDGLSATILTKGGAWGVERDHDLLTQSTYGYVNSISWGTTLTCFDEADSLKWEPEAATPLDRIASLYLAKKYGLHTWVSFEPVLYPEQVYQLLDLTHEITDHYKVGKLNYHPHAHSIDWRRFKGEIEARLQKLGKSYYLKKDLLEAAK